MTSFEWAAVLGAAAWIPQVLSWIARALRKPKVRVIPGKAPEIGYTSLGPIFNLPCAIAASGEDAIITKIEAELKHANGQATQFRWTTLNETFSQVRSPEGVAEVSKNQPAVALKVSTLVLTEKQVGMQEATFEVDSRPLITEMVDMHDHLKRTEHSDYQNRSLKSKEYRALLDFGTKRFPWQEGAYQVRLVVHLVGVAEPTVQVFTFKLTSIEVGRLRQNLELIEKYVGDMIKPAEGDESPSYRWYWAYPPFEEI